MIPRKTPAYAIFDVGKTNKKCLVFDDRNRLVEERQTAFPELADEDGFPCDDLARLTDWLLTSFENLKNDPRFELRGVNFTAYGASFVHLGPDDQPVAPLYNYLKPMPPALEAQFYQMIFEKFGQTKMAFAAATCSPPMGMLNSGLQLYFLKHTRPQIFEKIRTSLHLPQYLAWLISGEKTTDFTSLGCHTALWDFQKNDYHAWVFEEKIIEKLAPLRLEIGNWKLEIGNWKLETRNSKLQWVVASTTALPRCCLF